MEALQQYEQQLRQRNDELEARAAAALSQALAVKEKVQAQTHRDATVHLENLEPLEADIGSEGDHTECSAPETSNASARQQSLSHPLQRLQEQQLSRKLQSSKGGLRKSPGPSKFRELDAPVSAEAAVRLHKARIETLTCDLQALQSSLKQKSKSASETEKELQAVQKEKATWQKQMKQLEAQLEKERTTAEEARQQLGEKDALIRELSKDTVQVDKERKQIEADMKARQVRLTRALEEAEKFRKLLESTKAAQKDGKDIAKADYNKVLAENKKLERQKAEVVVAFKKQIKLIDILKQQKAHLEAARLLNFTEEEFSKALDSGVS